MSNEEVSNKTVLILAILVVLIVASSMWLVLNKLSDLNEPATTTVTITKIIKEAEPSGGSVGLTILQPPENEGEDK